MTEAPFPPIRHRRRALPRVLVAVFVVIVVAVAVASRVNLNYYVLSPGDAQSVAPLIKVPPGKTHPINGAVLLTDVNVAQVSALSYLPDLWSSNNQVIPAAELTGPDVPTSEFVDQGFLEMAQAKDAAKTAALRRLDYQVPEQATGAVVESVTSDTPASGVLHVGEVITAVDGVATDTECAFVSQLSMFGPGDTVHLAVEANRFTANGTLVPGPTVTRSVRLERRPAGLPAYAGCEGVRPSKGFLGISFQTQQDYTFPFPIVIQTPGIGGPSAGLAMTLGIINALAGGQLTGGMTIAATGTMDADGNVGDVGGVPQKTVAVEDAGATVFFVPPPELGPARSKATSRLRVYAVSTLAQALSILERLGGHVPPPPPR